jgi:hypothetical protein
MENFPAQGCKRIYRRTTFLGLKMSSLAQSSPSLHLYQPEGTLETLYRAQAAALIH